MATEKEVTAFAGCHFSSYLPHRSAYATSTGIGFRLLAPAMRRNAQLIIPRLPRPREAQCKWGCPNIASSWPRIIKYRKRQNGMVISELTLVHLIWPFLSYCRPLYAPPWKSQTKKNHKAKWSNQSLLIWFADEWNARILPRTHRFHGRAPNYPLLDHLTPGTQHWSSNPLEIWVPHRINYLQLNWSWDWFNLQLRIAEPQFQRCWWNHKNTSLRGSMNK